MAPQPPRLAPRFLAAKLGAPIGIACAGAAVLSTLFALLFSSSAAIAALVAGGAALIGVGLGFLVLLAIAANPNSEPAVALLFSSVVRLIGAAALALILQKSLALEARPFWFAFLFNFLAVLGAEVASAHRLFATPNPAAPQEPARP